MKVDNPGQALFLPSMDLHLQCTGRDLFTHTHMHARTALFSIECTWGALNSFLSNPSLNHLSLEEEERHLRIYSAGQSSLSNIL